MKRKLNRLSTIAICLSLLPNCIFSQYNLALSATSGSYAYAINPKVGTTLATWNPRTDPPSGYSLWTEFGNGDFSFSINPKFNYNTATGIGTNILSKASGIYVPPPIKPSTSILSTATGQVINADNIYAKFINGSNPNLELVSCTKDIVADDEIHFAINYKKMKEQTQTLGMSPQPTYTWKLYAGFNEGKDDIFALPAAANTILDSYIHSIDISKYAISGSAPSKLATPTTSNVTVTRQHKGEIATLRNSGSVPVNVNNVLGCKDYFEWVIPAASGNATGTVFFTLMPNEKITETSTNVKVMLAVFDAANNLVGSYTPSNDVKNFDIKDSKTPHDPNYETVNPRCNLLTEKPTKVLPYKIHFQNTGVGSAQWVQVTTILPSYVGLTDAFLKNNLKWKIGKTEIVTSTIADRRLSHPSGVDFEVIDQDALGTYKLTVTKKGGLASPILVFTFEQQKPDDVLAGFNPNGGIVDITTMGDIWFDLQTDASSPNELTSHSSIVFGSKNNIGSMEFQPPIYTNVAITEFKKSCTCNNNDTTKTPCDKVKQRSKFWQWLFCKECK